MPQAHIGGLITVGGWCGDAGDAAGGDPCLWLVEGLATAYRAGLSLHWRRLGGQEEPPPATEPGLALPLYPFRSGRSRQADRRSQAQAALCLCLLANLPACLPVSCVQEGRAAAPGGREEGRTGERGRVV